MRRLAVLLWLLIAALWWGWGALHAPPVARVLADGSRLDWGQCWFDTPSWRPVHCGWLRRPREGIALPVVYLPAFFWQRRQSPVLYVSGGPGGATGLDDEVMPAWLNWLDEVDWAADVILYDQRGVGRSRPAVDCPEVRAEQRALLDSQAPQEQQYRRLQDARRACRDRLLAEGVDLTAFHTPANADDALALVGALGLSRWRLYGVSYGTRVALEILRRAPTGLEAAVLDSVYPPPMHPEAQDAWLLARALHLATVVCERLGCEAPAMRLRADLEQAMARLRSRPLRLTLRDPAGGAPLTLSLDDADLAWLIFDAEYQWSDLERLPGLLAELADGRAGPITRALAQGSLEGLLGEGMSEAVADSVECSDNPPLSAAAFRRSLRRYPAVAAIKALDWRYSPCRIWPRAPVATAFARLVHSRLPVLLLAGEFDPVTPPQWAEAAARTLSRGEVLIFPGIGHGVLDSDACALEVVRAFWASPEAPAVPVCLAP